MTIVFMLTTALTPDALNSAIQQLKSVEAQKAKCAISTQIKAARMHLELMREAKDFSGPEGMAGGVAELEQEAKTSCTSAVTALGATVKILKGGTADPPSDQELEPEPPVAPPKKPAISQPPISIPQDLKGTLDALARVLGPGWKPLGDVKEAKSKRADWYTSLDAGKCYAFIAVGSGNAKHIAMYLFDASGKRRAAAKGQAVSSLMYLCPFVSGDYQLQAKVKHAENGYIIGTYVRD